MRLFQVYTTTLRAARSLSDRILRWEFSNHPRVDMHPSSIVRCVLDFVVADSGSVVIGAGSTIERSRFVAVAGSLQIGKNVFIGPRASIGVSGRVTIEDGVAIGPNVMTIDENKARDELGRAITGSLGSVEPATIGCHSWLGAGCSVLPGVAIGKGCVMGRARLSRNRCTTGQWSFRRAVALGA